MSETPDHPTPGEAWLQSLLEGLLSQEAEMSLSEPPPDLWNRIVSRLPSSGRSGILERLGSWRRLGPAWPQDLVLAGGLVRGSGDDAVLEMAAALEDPDDTVRIAAAETLLLAGPAAAAASLALRRALDDPSEEVRCLAAEALRGLDMRP